MMVGVGGSVIPGARISAFAAEATKLPFANGDRPVAMYPANISARPIDTRSDRYGDPPLIGLRSIWKIKTK
jgi:hypothetical protein